MGTRCGSSSAATARLAGATNDNMLSASSAADDIARQLFLDPPPFSVTPNTWAQLDSSGPGARSQQAAAWDPAGKRLYTYGGIPPAGGNWTNDLWRYDPATNAWEWLAPTTAAPPPGTAATAAWDPARGRLLVLLW